MSYKKDLTSSRSLRVFRPITVLLSFFGGLYMAAAIIVYLWPPSGLSSLCYGIAWLSYGWYCFYGLLDEYLFSGRFPEPPIPKRYSLPWSLIKTVLDGILIAISMNILSNAVAAKYPGGLSTLGINWSPAILVGWTGLVFIIARGLSLMRFEGWPFYDDIDGDVPISETLDDAN